MATLWFGITPHTSSRNLALLRNTKRLLAFMYPNVKRDLFILPHKE